LGVEQEKQKINADKDRPKGIVGAVYVTCFVYIVLVAGERPFYSY
jgi:hypothetical protein